jgi:hypothetical protein
MRCNLCPCPNRGLSPPARSPPESQRERAPEIGGERGIPKGSSGVVYAPLPPPSCHRPQIVLWECGSEGEGAPAALKGETSPAATRAPPKLAGRPAGRGACESPLLLSAWAPRREMRAMACPPQGLCADLPPSDAGVRAFTTGHPATAPQLAGSLPRKCFQVLGPTASEFQEWPLRWP